METLTSSSSFESCINESDEEFEKQELISIFPERSEFPMNQMDSSLSSKRGSLLLNRSSKKFYEKDKIGPPRPTEFQHLIARHTSSLKSKIKISCSRTLKDYAGRFSDNWYGYLMRCDVRYDIPNEKVLRSYSCALSLRILLHGRLYVTRRTIGFVSVFNDVTVFGFEPTILLIPFHDVIAIRKRTIALIFRNSIEIETSDQKSYLLASFLSRDKVFDFLIDLWESSTSASNKQEVSINYSMHYSTDEANIAKPLLHLACCSHKENSECPDANNFLNESFDPYNPNLVIEQSEPLPFPDVPTACESVLPKVVLEKIVCPNAQPPFPRGALKNIYSSIVWPVSLSTVIDEFLIKEVFFTEFLSNSGMANIHVKPWKNTLSLEALQNILKNNVISTNDNNFSNPSDDAFAQRPQRILEYEQPIRSSLPLGTFFSSLTSSSVKEHWTLFIYSQNCIILESLITICGVPFSNYFYIVVRYRFTEMSKDRTNVDMESQIFWRRWVVLKKKIEDEIDQRTKESFSNFSRLSIKHLKSAMVRSDSPHQCWVNLPEPVHPKPIPFPKQLPSTKPKCPIIFQYFHHLEYPGGKEIFTSASLVFEQHRAGFYLLILIFGCHVIFVSFYILHLQYRLRVVEGSASTPL